MSGVFDNTPVEQGGCVYAATGDGWVFALNAHTGVPAWKTRLPYSALGYATSSPDAITGSPTVDSLRQLIYVPVADLGRPYIAALAQATGRVVWKAVISTVAGTYTLPSPVVFEDRAEGRGTVVAGIGGDSSQEHYRGAMAFLDAATGTLLKTTYVVPDAAYATGNSGGSIWDTGAVDPPTRTLYIGTGNPEAQGPQYPLTDALLKVDLDRRHGSFGDILASYPGTPDTYLSALASASQPVCDNAPHGVPYPANSAVCLHQDFDFGASPNLFHGAHGELLVGDLQKAGIYHAAAANTMKGAWSTRLSAPCFPCNAASGAVLGDSVFTLGTPAGHLVSLNASAGSVNWLEPITDALDYHSTSAANGVVYAFDGQVLHAFDAATGDPLTAMPLPTTPNTPNPSELPSPNESSIASQPWIAGLAGISSSGVAIARHTVLVAGGHQLYALRLP